MKVFVPYDVVRDNGLKLAQQIYHDGFIPDVIYVSLRGGAYLGNIISEYFKLISERNNLKPVLYAAVVARSYHDPDSHPINVLVDGWTYDPKYLRNGDRVLLVDDIYDSGNTIDYLANVINQNGIQPNHLKIAVHDYKERTYTANTHPITPDYYCQKQTVHSADNPKWVHYLSHEFVGLTPEEIEHYYAPEAQSILTGLHSK